MTSNQHLARTISVVLLGLLLALQFALWAGDKNVFDLFRQRDKAVELSQENKELMARNDRLLIEVTDLKQGGQSVETIVRQELGFIKAGETFFQVVD